MHKIAILCLIAGLLFPQLGFSKKISLQKESAELSEKRIHPIVQHFSQNYHRRLEKIRTTRSPNFNRLLVLLIDFQEDDNPLTTGNGKFMLDPDDYAIPFGRPPHDSEFFEAQLEAMRYYYLAVSFGQFDLAYDIYPKPAENGDFRAYTLPQEMAYYNKIDGSYDEMVAGFEQYFYDALTVAETDPDIDFSQYEHFMFIHAGSDWQHDVFGDTPKDIPSFFIQMGEGKEHITADGIVIDSASNVPETITQDIRESNGEIYGYGLINAVMAHEFGHSLGFPDLYNVHNFRPAVGYYDVMDSGGAGVFGYAQYCEEEGREKFFFIEGGVPTLPGAWTRLLVPQWKEYFENRGYLRYAQDLPFDDSITILPSSLKPPPLTNHPYFIKIPLSDDEYLLVENRQVDPDGDGGTAFVGALPETPGSTDYRVLLHPTYTGDNSNPNYEYDFFLPGWFTPQGAAIGGGLLVWHIDESIVYGNNNFANNTINTVYSKRGVKIIEADNIQDIGNPYSYFWRGTAFEPYFKYMPVINQNGFFTGWDDYSFSAPDGSTMFYGNYHNDELSATSKPALMTNSGLESFYKIYDISSYPTSFNLQRNMTFKIGSTFFEQTEVITELESINMISQAANSSFFDIDRPEILVITDDDAILYNHIYSNQSDEWFERPSSRQFSPSHPVLTFDYDGNGSDEYFITEDNKLTILKNDGTVFSEYHYASTITDPPIFIDVLDILVVSTEDNLYLNEDFLPVPSARSIYNGLELFAVSEKTAYLIDLDNVGIIQTFPLQADVSQYQPVAYRDLNNPNLSAFFIQTDHGELLKFNSNGVESIFKTQDYTFDKTSQLALHFHREQHLPYLVFGASDYIFKIDIFGNLRNGYPLRVEKGKVLPYEFPRIIYYQNKLIHFVQLEEQYYFAFDDFGKELSQFSFLWLYNELPFQLFWDDASTRLYFIHGKNNLSASQLTASYLTIIDIENPIAWNGYRHNKYGLVEGSIEHTIDDMKLTAYSFPNPAKDNYLRIKVKHASDDINLRVYDIAGNRIYQNDYPKNPTDEQDLHWDIRHVSSGIYFGIIKSGSKEQKISIAIEK